MCRIEAGGIILGLLIMGGYYFARPKAARPSLDAKHSLWMWVWLAGLNIFTLLGAFQGWPGSAPEQLDSWYHPMSWLTFPYDTIWIVVFAILIYIFAQATALPAEKTLEYIAADSQEAATTAHARETPEVVG